MEIIGEKAEESTRLLTLENPVWDILEGVYFKVLPDDTLLDVKAKARRHRTAVIPVYKSRISDRAEGFIIVHDLLLTRSYSSTRKAGDIARITPLVTFQASIGEAYELMSRRRLPGLLVVESFTERNVLGTVTALGLLRELVYMGPPRRPRLVAAAYTELGEEVVSVHWRQPVTRVLNRIVGGDIVGAIVVDDEAHPQGIVTVWDFIKTNRWFTRDERKPKSIFGPTPALRGESRKVGVMKVQRLMRKGVPVATPKTPLRIVARFIAVTGIEMVPVIDDEGILIGAVTLWDALKE